LGARDKEDKPDKEDKEEFLPYLPLPPCLACLLTIPIPNLRLSACGTYFEKITSLIGYGAFPIFNYNGKLFS
jgi:hypothetical protein